MTDNGTLKGWWNTNQTLVIFLIAQLVGFVTAGASILAYSVRLEGRVNTLEIRGSPHLERIENRLAVLESLSLQNKSSIDRVVDVLTREINKNQQPGGLR